MLKLQFIFILLAVNFVAGAQQLSKTVQQEIMVIPRTKEGEDIRTILDANGKLRLGIAKVNEAFSKREFKTKDFLATLKEAKEANILTADNQTDLKSQLAMFAGADVYVETDLIAFSENGLTNVSVILSGYEASTGLTLSAAEKNSGSFRTSDTGQLASVAVERMSEEFLARMQTEFSKIREDGKSVKVYINFAQGSNYDTESEIGTTGKTFADLMEIWMENNAYKNYSKLQSSMPKSLIFTDVHIPFKDVDKTKRSDTPAKFRTLIVDYLKSLKLSATGSTKSSSIYITVK